jgi:hypothetical protein
MMPRPEQLPELPLVSMKKFSKIELAIELTIKGHRHEVRHIGHLEGFM